MGLLGGAVLYYAISKRLHEYTQYLVEVYHVQTYMVGVATSFKVYEGWEDIGYFVTSHLLTSQLRASPCCKQEVHFGSTYDDVSDEYALAKSSSYPIGESK